ncbi:MAG: hypothetical protein Q8Q50_08545 [Methylobacter sp.]|nr:hypothetical protein [Methylobacter sp.]
METSKEAAQAAALKFAGRMQAFTEAASKKNADYAEIEKGVKELRAELAGFKDKDKFFFEFEKLEMLLTEMYALVHQRNLKNCI